MAVAVIGLGSNLGKGPGNLWTAWDRLGAVKQIRRLAISSPYRSAPVGMQTSHWFTNAVGLIETDLGPLQLLDTLLAIEAVMGRKRQPGTQPADRVIDLDLLFYDELVINGSELILPHPAISKRLFVLAPLAELAASWRHPVLGRTSAEMLTAFNAGNQARQPDQVVEKMSWPGAGNRRQEKRSKED